MTKAIIFDLNGVFIQSPYLSDRFKEKFGVSTEDFLPALKEIMSKIRKPNAGDAFNYWKPYLEKWGVNLTKEQFFDFWFEAEKEVPDMIKLAKELKGKGLKLFILSNNFIERANYYKHNFPFLEKLFDKVYYSWQTGFVKPDPEAFKKLLTDNNLKSEECLYFDNSEENIEVANNLGIKSFLFDGVDGVKETLKQELT
jgi:HAD superfamily hydrolase (TIGR01509 family)